MYLVTAEEMRMLDRYTITKGGIPGIILMEQAGKAVAEEIMARQPSPGRAVILGGTGHNGGDGWVAARHLLYRGWTVLLWRLGKEEKIVPDAKVFYEACSRHVPVRGCDSTQLPELERDLRSADVIVDAMLGTGAKGELRQTVAEVVTLVNAVDRARVVAVDLPTGVDADTGAVSTMAVKADVTVTFQYPKWGHYLRPGTDFCGEVIVREIGLTPPSLGATPVPRARLNDPELWHEYCVRRDPWAHKGTYGHLLVIGGARGMLGAVAMAGEAAYRMGTGLVTLTVPESERLALAAKVTQAMVWSWPGDGVFAAGSVAAFRETPRRFSALAVGPGLGRFAGEEAWMAQLLEQADLPLVLDADACNILADYSGLLPLVRARKQATIFTPHPGEMARLMRLPVKGVEENRPLVARKLAERLQAIIVLKGRYTLIAFPDGRCLLNPTGGPALAKAGSGDLLTGMIGALLAQGVPAEKAVPMAVFVHGRAGEMTGMQEHSVMVTDLCQAIPVVIDQLVD
ncbi:NAD(P)H-hydrate dehydratase [Laceyella putida]|uniref:Bifunctional NAD(P)H-hydrate repair enzyme n=1 Tax=Laceyella putida TaxID=110101 RepID=A0ABW2RL13_9BACL